MMELKKNPKYDVDRRRGMFFNISLLVSIALVTAAFEWKSEEFLVDIPTSDHWEDDLMILPPMTEFTPPPPPKPKAIAPKVTETVDDEEETDVEIEFIDPTADMEIVIPEPVEVEEKQEEDIIFIAEVMPEPEKGMKSFYQFISKNLKYPNMAKKLGVTGRVFIQFVVDEEGNLTDIKAAKGIGGGCDEEAVRVFKKAKKWKPGLQRGRPVKVRMIMPITFELN